MAQDAYRRDVADDAAPSPDFLSGGGEMGSRMRALDWGKTALGRPEHWPQSLKTIIRVMLDSRYAMWMLWGSELTFFCNDAYLPTVGIKRDWVLGSRADKVWEEIWPDIGPRIATVLQRGEATWDERLLLFLERSGFVEETYHTFSYSPVYDNANRIAGMLCVVTEVTERVIGERRLQVLRELAARVAGLESVQDACGRLMGVLAAAPADVQFACLYLLDESQQVARLAASHGNIPSHLRPGEVSLRSAVAPWPLAQVDQLREPRILDLDCAGDGRIAAPLWPEQNVQRAMVMPVQGQGFSATAAILVAGISPRRAFDAAYQDFLGLVAGQFAAALADARAYEAERRRAEALAEIDRAKTIFFSNISHEFRTPLTLLLGPVEEALRLPDTPAATREQLELAHRNALRLLKLVNSLLDFSRLEAGRVQATYEPVDLTSLTRDLASTFRSAIERAGLRFIVTCDDLSEPVYVDREMWEKIVLNLLSNAFKFTLAGQVTVRLRQDARDAVLEVADTGVGIPEDELQRVFERFHRVEGTSGRTQEGSGIGLALVHELVKLHGGAIDAASHLREGTTFRVRLPLGTAHLAAERIRLARTHGSGASGAQAYVQEALRWLADDSLDSQTGILPVAEGSFAFADRPAETTDGARIVLADDNADMRAYLRELLSAYYTVETVPDGEAALAAVRRKPPDLIISDVMMPGMDGFELLRALRSDVQLNKIPMLLLSARAGEEARIEGLESGADDYLVKPFSARELLARVSATLKLSRARREFERQMAAELAAITRLRDQGELWVRSGQDFERCIETMLDAAISITGAQRGNVQLAQPNGTLKIAAQRGFDKPFLEFFGCVNVGDATACAAAMQSCKRIAVEDVDASDIFANSPVLEVLRAAHVRAVQATPLVSSAGEILGMISTHFERPRRLSERDSHWLDLLARQAAEYLERRASEKAVRASERLYRGIGESLNYGIWVCDADGENVYASDSFLHLTGLTLQQYCGSEWLSVLHPDDRGSVEAAWEECVKAGGGWYHEHRILGADGDYHPILAQGVAIRDDSGRIERWAGIHLDIRRLKLTEQALRDADRRKDEFLAILAHELRNPLAPIRNALFILNSARADARQQQHARDIIDHQVRHMSLLLDDLLDISRMTRGRFELRREYVDLKAVFDRAVETARPLIEAKQHSLRVLLPPKPVTLEADPLRLAQVISNLLSNAAKYTDAGGQISLSAKLTEAEILLSVADNGIGLRATSISRLFTLFSQVDSPIDRSEGGLGIGLALVKGLVELHGGTVDASSPGPRRGSTFTVHLPRTLLASDTPKADSRATVVAALPLGGCKVVAADDNRDAVDTLAVILQGFGHQVQVAYSGREALELAAHNRPDALILDIGMPEMNGYEIARRVRHEAWGHDALLIAVTGWGQVGDKEKAAGAGFDHHFTKPVDPQSIAQLLAALARQVGPGAPSSPPGSPPQRLE